MHILSPTYVHVRACTEWVRQPTLQQVARTCMPGLHTHTSTPVLMHIQAGIYYICAVSQVCVPGQRHTHMFIHTCLHKDSCVLHTHTEESHMCCRASQACAPRAGCAHRVGVHKENTHTVVSHTHVHKCHTDESVTHRHTWCISHIHTGVTKTRVSRTQRCLTHVQFTHVLQPDTHTWSKLCTQLSVAEIHALGDVSRTLVCFIHAWVCHTMSFRQNGFHTLGCVSQIHTQCLRRTEMSHTLTQTRVSPKAHTASQTHRVIHAGVTDTHSVSYIVSHRHRGVAHTCGCQTQSVSRFRHA